MIISYIRQHGLLWWWHHIYKFLWPYIIKHFSKKIIIRFGHLVNILYIKVSYITILIIGWKIWKIWVRREDKGAEKTKTEQVTWQFRGGSPSEELDHSFYYSKYHEPICLSSLLFIIIIICCCVLWGEVVYGSVWNQKWTENIIFLYLISY